MFGRSIKLFTIFGFRVSIDLSWLIILVLVVWTLAGGVFPQTFPDLPRWTHWVMGLAAALGLFASIVFHEMWHSLIARRYGMPMEGITLFLFGGVAEMKDQPPSPKAEFWMAVAGPLASVFVAGMFLGLTFLGYSLNWPDQVTGVTRWIGVINIILVIFNLIPGFPLDGGRVLRSILWHFKGNLRKATRTASRVGGGFGLVLIGIGILNLLSMNPLGGLWWILIGMFIRAAAKQGYQQVLVRQMLKGEPVKRFMNPDPVTVTQDVTIDRLVDEYVYHYHHKLYPVVKDGRLVGCVTTRDIRQVPREKWSEQTVGDVADSCSDENTIGPEEDAMDVLTQMSSKGKSRYVVVEDSTVKGIVSLKDLMGLLALKLELEDENPSEAGVSKGADRNPVAELAADSSTDRE
ncbi:MAG: site-2 protease family protein [Phycisphaerae bacterium]